MFNIQFQAAQVLWLWLPILSLFCAGVAWYNIRRLDAVRDYWSDRVMLDRFSPRNPFENRSLWTQWVLFLVVLLVALAGPNISRQSEMVPAGAVQVQFLFDVSNSMGAEDYRSYLPAAEAGKVPDPAFQWGTRLDAAKYYIYRDLLPQLQGNEAGIITVEGVGYNLWDITPDLGKLGAFHHMLDRFVQTGAAPGGGGDYSSGIKAALDEFDLISALEKKSGDTSPKVRFIVLFSDGGFTGDQAALDKILDTLNEKKVRLLIVAMGGDVPVTVAKYDAQSHRRNGQYYKGATRLDPTVLIHMRDRVKDSELIYATPGKADISYSFPKKAGGLYAKPAKSNLRPWLYGLALIIFASITAGGGGRPRWKYFSPRELLVDARRAVSFLVSLTSLTSLATRPKSGSNLKDKSDV